MRRLFLVAALVLVVVPSAVAKLPLERCHLGGATGLCGRVVVLEDRAKPEGRTIALRVMVLPATGAKPLPDPVFYLAGGPGGSATGAAGTMRTTFAPLNDRHDIVLVDQRGVGGSNALLCPEPKTPLSTPAAGRAFVRECLSKLDADPSQYGTAVAMDDLDAVRRALGYGRIDLFGGSYGATAAQVYLNRHPGSVRSVVLDGGTLLTVPIFERLGSNGQRTIDLLARACAGHPRCAKAYPTWKRDLPGLVAHLARHPVTVSVAGVGRVTLNAAEAGAVIQALTLSPVDAGQVPYVVARAARGDYQPLARAAVRPSSAATPPYAVMPYSVMCNEPWAVRRPAQVAADARGTYLEATARAWALRYSAICSVFPKRSERAADWRSPRSAVPVLAVVGGSDPQDPLGSIAPIRRTMPNTRFVVVPGGLHTNSQFGCLPSLVARFVDGAGAGRLDTRCVATPMQFAWVLP